MNEKRAYTCRVFAAQIGAATTQKYNMTHCYVEQMRDCSIVVATREAEPEPEPIVVADDTTTTTTTTSTITTARPGRPRARPPSPTPQSQGALLPADYVDEYADEGAATQAEGQTPLTIAVQSLLRQLLHYVVGIDAKLAACAPEDEEGSGASPTARPVLTAETRPSSEVFRAASGDGPTEELEEGLVRAEEQMRQKRAERTRDALADVVVNATRKLMGEYAARVAPLLGATIKAIVNGTGKTTKDEVRRIQAVVEGLFERRFEALRQEVMQVQVFWIRPLTDMVKARLDELTAAVNNSTRRPREASRATAQSCAPDRVASEVARLLGWATPAPCPSAAPIARAEESEWSQLSHCARSPHLLF